MESQSFEGDIQYKAHPEVIFSEMSDGEAVLLHMKSKLYYSLNTSGSFMWKILEEEKNVPGQHLVDQLTSHYKIPPETAESDVLEFLSELLSENLVEKGKPLNSKK